MNLRSIIFVLAGIAFTTLLLTCSPKTGKQIASDDDIAMPTIEKHDLPPLVPDKQVDPAYYADKTLKYRDYVYDPYIKTVELHPTGRDLDLPVYILGSGQQLYLQFDDINGGVNNYYYTLVLCNSDWTPSDVNQYDYIDGFTEESIFTYNFSFNTQQKYTHYAQYLPSEDMKITKSGNYLLKVYRENDPNDLLFTKRLYVVDPKVVVKAQVKRPAFAEYHNSHQQVLFDVLTTGFDIRDPYSEVTVNMMQNNRWDNMLTGMKPLFVRDNDLTYDYQDKMTFPAGKEFRYADVRSVRFKTETVRDLNTDDFKNELWLYDDKPRSYLQYFYKKDINGNYIIETKDAGDNELEADYAWVHFALPFSAPIVTGGVYVFGELSDWDALKPYEMTYNNDLKQYEANILLKMGYYNYEYIVSDDSTHVFDQSVLEGNYYETENNYIVFVYYRPFGERYDQLICTQTVNSLSY